MLEVCKVVNVYDKQLRVECTPKVRYTFSLNLFLFPLFSFRVIIYFLSPRNHVLQFYLN